jgi:hypothetical protein
MPPVYAEEHDLARGCRSRGAELRPFMIGSVDRILHGNMAIEIALGGR